MRWFHLKPDALRQYCFVLLFVWSQALAFDEQTLTEILSAERDARNMPGLRAAVRWPDGREVAAAIGWADIEAKVALDTTTPMPGGSTGKTFVAALTLMMAEEGFLSVDDLAAKWLSDTDWFARLPNAQTIRVGDLLSHSAGIADYPSTLGFQFKNAWRRIRTGSAYFSPEELIGFATNKRAPYAAGEGYNYSDTGYLVLGRLLEAATQRDYYELLEERILTPFKLHHIDPVDHSNPTGIPTGYNDGGPFGLSRVLDKEGRMKLDPASEWTGGGLNTTPSMLVQFFSLLAGGKIVQPNTFKQMIDGGYKNPKDSSFHYGFGLFVIDQGQTIMHGGMWPGYRSRVQHSLDSGISIAIQTNRDGRVVLNEIIQRIASQIDSEKAD